MLSLVIPLLFALPLQLFLENSLKGDNKIFELALLRVFPGLLYLGFAYWVQQTERINLSFVVHLYLVTIIVVCLTIVSRLKPRFKEFKTTFSKVLNETRHYGRHVYIGILSNVGTTQFGGMALAFFIDPTAVGYFVLARTIAMPLTMIASNIGAAFFKSFAHSKGIPIKVVHATLGISAVTLIIFYLVIGKIVDLVYPEEFKIILPLIYIIAFGAVILGIGDFVNNFLCAHGHGKKSRNAAFLQGFINCLGFTFLVNWYGEYGAAMTVVLANLGFTIMILFFYRKVRWS
jgi:O-antigen/teichoic acid export membrane protein